MAVLLCCGADGLWAGSEDWQPVSCPLPAPMLLATEGTSRIILDNTEHLLWQDDQLFPVDSGVESLLLWHGQPLLLSGDTDCLTLLDPSTGAPQFLAPVGVYPQDMCLLPGNLLAVCSGAAGAVHLLHLPELYLQRSIRVPGSAQRITWHSGWLYVLCATEDDGLRCLLCRIHPNNSRYEPLYTMVGLPGAVHANKHGLWVAASEALYRFRPGESKPSQTIRGFGLVRHIISRSGRMLLSDPVLGTLFLLDEHSNQPAILMEGDVGQPAFI